MMTFEYIRRAATALRMSKKETLYVEMLCKLQLETPEADADLFKKVDADLLQKVNTDLFKKVNTELCIERSWCHLKYGLSTVSLSTLSSAFLVVGYPPSNGNMLTPFLCYPLMAGGIGIAIPAVLIGYRWWQLTSEYNKYTSCLSMSQVLLEQDIDRKI